MKSLRRLVPEALLLLAACGDGSPSGPGERSITAVFPAPGAQGVSVITPVRVTLEGDFPDAPLFRLETGGVSVRVEARLEGESTMALLPLEFLAPQTTYTAHFSAEGADTSWTFTTGPSIAYDVDHVRLFAHVRALAHDSMRGRGSGTADELRAAGYIAAEFARYGLAMALPGTWVQPFDTYDASQNVLAVLPGTGALANSWIVLGAHYDHLGFGGGQIRNGADDNASGTAGLLEIARVLAAEPPAGAARRSILFAAFGAEETGLNGSNYFCAHPPFPADSIMAMVNLDMIGRLRDGVLVADGLQSSSAWAGLLAGVNDGLMVAGAGVNSDQRCFREVLQRPVLALHTGLHADYHRATDDAERINVPGLTRVSDMALQLLRALAVRPDTLPRTPLGP